ncbi:MAG TPA: fibronectin type III domain-containing protein [Pseudobdellovibrionaceae bacterium]|jgi:hypothetical protein
MKKFVKAMVASTILKLFTTLKMSIVTSLLFMIIMTLATSKTYAANMLYKMNFGSDTVLYSPQIAYSTAGWQNIAGTSPSGQVGPISVWGATRSGFDMIADAPVTTSTLGNYMTNQIQQVVGPNGQMVKALFQNVKISTAAPPTWGPSQDAFMIYRGSVDSGDKTDTGDVYYTYWFKFQSDLRSQLGGGDGRNWRVMSEWKTGGLNNTWKGDYRIITHVVLDGSGRLYWNTQGDNNANGISARQTFWQVQNFNVPVPAGEWFKYEVFWHRSSGSDGRYWAAVNGQTIVDHWGPNKGVYNLPINRIMLANNYSGGKTPCQQWVTGLEIWNGFPCGVGASCYGKTGTTTPTPTPAPTTGAVLTAPSGLVATPVSSTSVKLTWNVSQSSAGGVTYWIYRNGVNIAKSTVPSFTDTKAVSGATYGYNLNAHDSAGKVSTPSNYVTVKVP